MYVSFPLTLQYNSTHSPSSSSLYIRRRLVRLRGWYRCSGRRHLHAVLLDVGKALGFVVLGWAALLLERDVTRGVLLDPALLEAGAPSAQNAGAPDHHSGDEQDGDADDGADRDAGPLDRVHVEAGAFRRGRHRGRLVGAEDVRVAGVVGQLCTRWRSLEQDGICCTNGCLKSRR